MRCPSSFQKRVVLADSNVIINLVHIGRMDLLGSLPGLEFKVPDEVVREITHPDQKAALQRAIEGRVVERLPVEGPEALTVFAELHPRLRAGEAACLALAATTERSVVASDERLAFRREATARLGEGRILTTPGILVLAIRHGLMSIDEADAAKACLEAQHFRMSFKSFRECPSDEGGDAGGEGEGGGALPKHRGPPTRDG